MSEKINPFDAEVIIIGGGPAGVAAALELRKQQITRVILLERETTLGGATRHCQHSPFGMREFAWCYFGPHYAQKLTQLAHAAGIEIRTGHSVVALEADGRICVSSINGLQWLHAKRVVVATGARETPRSARLLSGERPLGILTTGALQAHLAFHDLIPFTRPLIVGSELVSFSALITCLAHGIRPTKMIESCSYVLARRPLSWCKGTLVHCDTELSEIIGHDRVQAVQINQKGISKILPCDGVLLTGQFVPESSLFLQSTIAMAPGSHGPLIDQYGRCQSPRYFSAGNVLRAVETGGWAYREGRAVGRTLADDLRFSADFFAPTPVTHDAAIKLVVPGMLRKPASARATKISPAFRDFQLRMHQRVRGELGLQLDGNTVWKKRAIWWPERRITIPIPAQAQHAQKIHLFFRRET